MVYTKEKPLKVGTLCSGYDSQCLALEKLKELHPTFDYDLIFWSEIDKYAIEAHNAIFPQFKDRNLGDMATIDWSKVTEKIDLLTYSTPCFPAGTLVMTSEGYKNIEDIQEGDNVLTHLNRFRPVITPMQRLHKGTMIKIKSGITHDLRCTANHPIYVRKKYRVGHDGIRTFDAPEWKEAHELFDLYTTKKKSEGYYVGYAINQESRNMLWDGSTDNRWGHNKPVNALSPMFSKPSFWYVIGRYLGDGWTRRDIYHQGVVIACGGRNEEKLVSAIKDCGFNSTVVNERTVRKYFISSKELKDFVERYGQGAAGKKIDGDTLLLSQESLLPLYNGLMDSDGCCTKGLNRYTSVSKELVYGIQQLVAKVIMQPVRMNFCKRKPTTTIEGRIVNQKDTYTLMWKNQSCKQDKFFYEDGYIWAPISGMEAYEDELTVYNMEVEEDHTYTANGVIVHNCQDISNAGTQKGLKEGSGTRSSLLWYTQKAIEALHPRFLMLENVKALTQKKFMPDFRKWLEYLESEGYVNFWKVLNAKDYGVPQNRERVFVISVYNEPDFNFSFPPKEELNKCLEDVLEEEVDESYYLSDERVAGLLESSDKEKLLGNGFEFVPKND